MCIGEGRSLYCWPGWFQNTVPTMFPDCFATDRMRLRPIVMADAEPILQAYATDPAVTRFLTWRPHRGVAARLLWAYYRVMKEGRAGMALA